MPSKREHSISAKISYSFLIYVVLKSHVVVCQSLWEGLSSIATPALNMPQMHDSWSFKKRLLPTVRLHKQKSARRPFEAGRKARRRLQKLQLPQNGLLRPFQLQRSQKGNTSLSKSLTNACLVQSLERCRAWYSLIHVGTTLDSNRFSRQLDFVLLKRVEATISVN